MSISGPRCSGVRTSSSKYRLRSSTFTSFQCCFLRSPSLCLLHNQPERKKRTGAGSDRGAVLWSQTDGTNAGRRLCLRMCQLRGSCHVSQAYQTTEFFWTSVWYYRLDHEISEQKITAAQRLLTSMSLPQKIGSGIGPKSKTCGSGQRSCRGTQIHFLLLTRSPTSMPRKTGNWLTRRDCRQQSAPRKARSKTLSYSTKRPLER